MKITIYELIEMIKDDKASDITTDFIFDKKKFNLISFLDVYALDNNSLNWEIEIQELEKKIPEKINSTELYLTESQQHIIVNKLNEIIDYLKRKGDKK